jgi:hypothetical protein
MDMAALGIVGALVIVIGYLLASNRTDRAQHRENVDVQLARNERLQAHIEDLEKELDVEMNKRRAAEDRAAKAERGAAVNRHDV